MKASGKKIIKKGFDSRRIAMLGFFTAAAIILSIIENAFPPLLAFAPGAKLGLGNIVTLVVTVLFGFFDAFIILIIRCLVSSIFVSGLSSLMYSLPAGLLALLIQALIFRFVYPKISIIAVSIIGAVTHNLTQVTVASLIIRFNLSIILPFTLIAAIIAGIFTGIICYLCVKILPKKLYLL